MNAKTPKIEATYTPVCLFPWLVVISDGEARGSGTGTTQEAATTNAQNDYNMLRRIYDRRAQHAAEVEAHAFNDDYDGAAEILMDGEASPAEIYAYTVRWQQYVADSRAERTTTAAN